MAADLAAILSQFLNPDTNVRNTAEAAYFTIETSDPVSTACVLCQLAASSDNTMVRGQALLRIHHLLISGDLPSDVSAQIQVALVEILEHPDASPVDWSMITGTMLAHIGGIVTRGNSEWCGLMRSMSDLLSVNFSGIMPVFIALYQISPSLQLFDAMQSKLSQIQLSNTHELSNIVVFNFVHLAHCPSHIETQLSQTLLCLFNLPDNCLREPLNVFSLFFDQHNLLIPVQSLSAICHFLLSVVESEGRYELLRVQCLFTFYELLSCSEAFRCVAREAFDDVFRVYCVALSNPNEFETIAAEAHHFRRVAELVDVSILNEAIGSVLCDNPHVCCFFLRFLHMEDSLETALQWAVSEDEWLRGDSLRAIEEILKAGDHYGRFLSPIVALIVDGLATPGRLDYVELLETLMDLDVLPDDVLQSLMSALHASLVDVEDHRLFRCFGMLCRRLNDEDTARGFLDFLMRLFTESENTNLLEPIGDCLKLVPNVSILGELDFTAHPEIARSRGFLKILESLGPESIESIADELVKFLKRETEEQVESIFTTMKDFSDGNGDYYRVPEGLFRIDKTSIYTLEAYEALVELVFMTCQDREPQFTTDTITVVRHLLRNAFLNDVVEGAVRIVREACEVYVGRHQEVDSALFEVVLDEMDHRHSDPSVLANLVSAMDVLLRESEWLTPEEFERGFSAVIRVLGTSVERLVSGGDMDGFEDDGGLNFVISMDRFIRFHHARDREFTVPLLSQVLEAIPSFTDESNHIVVRMISMQLLSVSLSSCGGDIGSFVEEAVTVIGRSEGGLQQQAMESLCSLLIVQNFSAETKMGLELFAELSRDCRGDTQQTAACCSGKLLVQFFEFINDWGLIWDIVKIMGEIVGRGEIECLSCLVDVVRRIAGTGHQEHAQMARDIISHLEAGDDIIDAILVSNGVVGTIVMRSE
jgi:hypothetical protein